jgi:tetratricopeptide (TPR) repeat protein
MTLWIVWAALRMAVAGTPQAVPLPAEIQFDADARGEVEGARADLAAGRFAEAERRFAAVAEASGSPDARYLQALSAYEGGSLATASRAIDAGLSREPGHAPLLLLAGLVKADQGRGDEAFRLFDRAAAAAPGDTALRARVALNRGVVRLDQGELDVAEQAFRTAKSLASAAGVTEVVALADENLRVVGEVRGKGGAADGLSKVSERLRKGDVAGARAVLPEANPADRRTVVRRALAEGNIARAEGRWGPAQEHLARAAEEARQAGLVREQAAALADLGMVYGLAGRGPLGAEHLAQAIALVDGTSFRLNELTYRIEAGRIACRTGGLDEARRQFARAREIAAMVQDPVGSARLAELEGAIAAKSDKAPEASAAFERAIRTYEGLGFWAEAARVGAATVELLTGRDAAAAASAQARASELFRRAGDPLGDAHLAISAGLGAAARGQLDVALRAFAAAAESAEQVKTPRGEQLARIAREDAAQMLLGLGHSAAAVEKAKEFGLESMVAREKEFASAEAAYEKGRAAHDAGRYSDARAAFDQAFRGFEAIGERGYALQARRGRAWAEFNAATTLSTPQAFPVWQKLVEESLFVQDGELHARSMAAVGLAAGDLKRPEAADSLRAGADVAERAGLIPVAGQCYAMLADIATDLRARASAARKAMQLRSGDKVAVYAMYSVAVDAFNAEDYVLARSLAAEALPYAVDLKPSLKQILDSLPQ